jgi:hypothetical protein
MVADPQITTPWELGLFILAPVSLAILVGNLLRWKERRLERPLPQDVWSPKTPAIARTGLARPSFEGVEGPSNADCDSHQSVLETKVVT